MYDAGAYSLCNVVPGALRIKSVLHPNVQKHEDIGYKFVMKYRPAFLKKGTFYKINIQGGSKKTCTRENSHKIRNFQYFLTKTPTNCLKAIS